jgi:hypothetical protein
MKLVRSALLFAISIILFSACFNEPEFSDVPAIEYEGIYFGRSPDGDDSLVVSISFKDGDGNMGLDGRVDVDSPYHDINFYANDNGELFPLTAYNIQNFTGYTLGKSKKTPQRSFYQVGTPPKQLGELITLQSRNEGFPSLPPYVDPYKCPANDQSYLNRNDLPDTVFIYKTFKYLIKNKATIVDSLIRNDSPSQYWFAVVDYFYIQPNIGQYNMYVEFFIKDNTGSFTEYDFAAVGCETHHGRFPILTDKKRPLEGIINYSMTSSGFLTTFGNKTLKLRITILDRVLNQSNTLETPEFRLEEI